jgi:acyl carrier protein
MAVEQVRESMITALREMNYDTSQITGATVLGPEGLDLESLAVAELAVRLQDQYGVKLQEEEMFELAGASLDEMAAVIDSRIGGAVSAEH